MKWILIKEKLPETGCDWYLVCGEVDGNWEFAFAKYQDDKWEFQLGSDPSTCNSVYSDCGGYLEPDDIIAYIDLYDMHPSGE
jgi:hypothetical protein